jgi:ATP-dependent DNA helicase PIF1
LAQSGYNAYKQFQIVVELEEVMRQETSNDPDQIHFKELLPRFRNGDATLDDYNLLIKRVPTDLNKDEFMDAFRIFPENIPCNKYNIEKISILKRPITALHANNFPPYAKRIDEDHFNGLPNLIYLCVDAKIMITSNLWKKVGITNGATGTVKAILYNRIRESNSLPHSIVIHFDIYTGPQFFNDPDRKNWIPINPLTFFDFQTKTTRQQMPIKLGYAITVHKSQGQTLDKGVIDLTDIERNLGSSYVQLTRFKNISSFLIMPFSFSRITKQIKNSKALKPRMEEEKRLKHLANQTLQKYKHILNLIENE